MNDTNKCQGIQLRPMSDEMYYCYFKEYENDSDLYFDKKEYKHYEYSDKAVAEYIERQKLKKRIPMAIMIGDEIIGEMIFKDIIKGLSVTLSIALKNNFYKNKGYGSCAERLALQYAFDVLNVKTVYADSILTNTRSQHVLKKVGFTETHRDDKFVYYKFEKNIQG